MKKILLIAALAITGVMNANVNSSKNEIFDEYNCVNNEQSKMEACVVFYATCTAATTCFQGDTFEDIENQAVAWAVKIQNNYCMYNSPYKSNDTILY